MLFQILGFDRFIIRKQFRGPSLQVIFKAACFAFDRKERRENTSNRGSFSEAMIAKGQIKEAEYYRITITSGYLSSIEKI